MISLLFLLHFTDTLGAGGEGDYRGWDGWMASPTRWTWVWVDSRSWWWTGRPGVLQSWGCKELDMTERLNWTDTLESSREGKYHILVSEGEHIKEPRIRWFKIRNLLFPSCRVEKSEIGVSALHAFSDGSRGEFSLASWTFWCCWQSLAFLGLCTCHSSLLALLPLGVHMVSPSVCLSLCPNFSFL